MAKLLEDMLVMLLHPVERLFGPMAVMDAGLGSAMAFHRVGKIVSTGIVGRVVRHARKVSAVECDLGGLA